MNKALNRGGTLALCTFLIFVLLTLGSGFVSVEASGENWLVGFDYRRRLTWDNATGAGTNYQLNLTVHGGIGVDSGYELYLDENCSNFPDDIRFTDNDGNTLLPYWNRTVDSNTQVFWFKVTDNMNVTDTDVYIYYGNSTVSNADNFSNTFIWGDPFTNSTLNSTLWTSVTGNPTYSINTASHYMEITDMDFGWHLGYGFHGASTITFPSQYLIDSAYGLTDGIYYYVDSAGTSDLFKAGYCTHHTSWSSGDYGVSHLTIGDHWGGSENWAVLAGVGGNDDYGSGMLGLQPATINVKMWKLAGNITVSEDGTERVDEANSETPDRMHIMINRLTGYPFGTVRLGAFFIRKYAEVEPSLLSVGSVETGAGVFPENMSSIITNIESGDQCYIGETFYIFQSTARDNDSDLDWMTIAFTDGEHWGNFTFTVSTGLFTRDSGYEIVELDTDACTNSTSGYNYIANFHVRFKDSVDPSEDVDIYMTCRDENGATDEWEVINNNYFDIVYSEIELIEFSSDLYLFILCIVILVCSFIGLVDRTHKVGIIGWVGFIFSLVLLLPNLMDPSVDPIIAPLLQWTIIFSFFMNLIGSAFRMNS